MAKQKLELTWIGKGEEINAEPRILLYDKEKSYGDQNAENMLIHGDNLLALKALEQEYAGKVKCIYIDPPFNTGAAFEHYDDNVEHSIWLNLMHQRFLIMWNLLSHDGVIYVNLDDSEAAYAKVLLDEIFGRKNYLNEIIVATNKSFGFKSTSDGIFKQANHILFYAKDKSKFSININAMFIEKEYDEQYKWVFENCDKDESEWTWRNIKEVVAESMGYSSVREASSNDNINFKEKIAEFAIGNANRVFRTASVTGGALLKRKETIKKSKINKKTIIRHPNDDMDYMFIGGERVIYYVERLKELDGLMLPAETITDIWNDISVEGLAKEGGVDFPKGKKPEKLIQRCLELTTKEGDIVLDSFLGSGTTAAVAHKMGRKYIGIELGEHCYTHSKLRLEKVIDGEQSGISKAINWQGGGGFRFYELAPSLLKKDDFGNWIIDSEVYNADLLAAAVAKLNGYYYIPDETAFWKQGKSMEQSYIFTTTQYVTAEYLDNLSKEMEFGDRLLVCCPAFDTGLQKRYDNIVIKKIPQSVLDKCEYGKSDYNLNIIDTDDFVEEDYDELEL
ncbi:MAG: site-specific DNA-methyltransferase [Bacteroidales bacterium]|nr:site-specific DNA-methyltransferase [Bacteroidales bacterium]